MSILVFGHKNPDTDSICSSIAYANLKRSLGQDAIACALGEVRKEAEYALNYFKVDAPKVIDSVKVQVKDLSFDKENTLNLSSSLLEAYNLMNEKGVETVPVADEDGKFAGCVSLKEIANELLYQHFKTIDTTISNICKNLDGKVIVNCSEKIHGRVFTLSFDMETVMETLEEGDIVIVGNRFDAIEYAIDNKAALIVLTSETEISDELKEKAERNNVSVVTVKTNNYKTSNTINHCACVESLVRECSCDICECSFAEDLKLCDKVLYPVVDKDKKILGVLSSSDLVKLPKKDVILVDHNEFGQSADGLESANILEIIDHHKLGGISTDVPLSVRLMPVGCSCTIIYNMYKENKVEVPYEIAGLLLSAILSDTLIFKSPTTTELDKQACIELAEIAKVDMEKYGMDMFKYGTSLDEYSIEEIVNMDFKKFDMSGKNVGIGQVFTLDIDSIFAKQDQFLEYINSTDFDLLVLAVTDIIKEGSYLIYKAPDNVISEAFDVDAKQGVFVEGCVSRKKQLVPGLTNAVKNM
ncbi:putative manganese-dependent inorganic diphosphatase [Peptacetobacter sp.]|uniref:putative manganese-dependent inorganic diphosphatase n=1 Tax=Peptacetobacter sp. TaxID=2991975 RepID=UPI002624D31A|nr:putative manganese-dependent inorganic diphosphatase [Peptacetobacter sp.]